MTYTDLINLRERALIFIRIKKLPSEQAAILLDFLLFNENLEVEALALETDEACKKN